MPTPLSATPEPVELVGVGLERGHQPPRRATKPTTPTGTLMKKIHSQPSAVDQDAAEDRADQRGDAGGGAPQRHRLAAALGREDPGDDRHRLRRDHRGAEALDDPGDDQHLDRAGQAAPQRREREDRRGR